MPPRPVTYADAALFVSDELGIDPAEPMSGSVHMLFAPRFTAICNGIDRGDPATLDMLERFRVSPQPA